MFPESLVLSLQEGCGGIPTAKHWSLNSDLHSPGELLGTVPVVVLSGSPPSAPRSGEGQV